MCAVEAPRGCGFRKVGGLYLVGGGPSLSCDRIPYELKECPVCGAGVKFTRGFQWLDWEQYAGDHTPCKCPHNCAICYPVKIEQPYGLIWVGEIYYKNPADFVNEALRMGVSRRIPAIPKKLKLGETWVMFAHRSACGTRQTVDDAGVPEVEGIPGVFYAFRPQRVEKLIWESEAKPEHLEALEKQGITPVIIPDGDKEHDPKTPLKTSDSRAKEVEIDVFFSSLRSKLGHRASQPESDWELEDEFELR